MTTCKVTCSRVFPELRSLIYDNMHREKSEQENYNKLSDVYLFCYC